MIERANIEESKSNVAMNTCAATQASYACGYYKVIQGTRTHLTNCVSEFEMLIFWKILRTYLMDDLYQKFVFQIVFQKKPH